MNDSTNDTTRFADRVQAGELLADVLVDAGLKDPIVLGLARGGVVVAGPIAQRLGVPLEVFVARKLGAPNQPELAVGALAEGVSPHGEVVNVERAAVDAVGATKKVIDLRIHEEHEELVRRQNIYRGDRKLPDTTGRDVVVVDDGIATGHTARAACTAIMARRPSRLVLAVPVSPRSALQQFSDVEVVALRRPHPFHAVGQWFESFDPVSDQEILELLDSFDRSC